MSNLVLRFRPLTSPTDCPASPTFRDAESASPCRWLGAAFGSVGMRRVRYDKSEDTKLAASNAASRLVRVTRLPLRAPSTISPTG